MKIMMNRWEDVEILSIMAGSRLRNVSTRSVKDGSPRLLFDYVLKEVDMKVEKSQYHAMMRVQSSLKFLELARCRNNFADRNSSLSCLVPIHM